MLVRGLEEDNNYLCHFMLSKTPLARCLTYSSLSEQSTLKKYSRLGISRLKSSAICHLVSLCGKAIPECTTCWINWSVPYSMQASKISSSSPLIAKAIKNKRISQSASIWFIIPIARLQTSQYRGNIVASSLSVRISTVHHIFLGTFVHLQKSSIKRASIIRISSFKAAMQRGAGWLCKMRKPGIGTCPVPGGGCVMGLAVGCQVRGQQNRPLSCVLLRKTGAFIFALTVPVSRLLSFKMHLCYHVRYKKEDDPIEITRFREIRTVFLQNQKSM